MLVDMTKSLVKPTNILLTLKKNSEDNVTIINQVFNARYSYGRSVRGSIIKLQQLMMLLKRGEYIHCSRCDDIHSTHSSWKTTKERGNRRSP